jgi:hypothetical protein
VYDHQYCYDESVNRIRDSKTGRFVSFDILTTKPDSAYFWSGRTSGVGGENTALIIARRRGGTTLEGMLQDKGIAMPVWDDGKLSSMRAWEHVSAEYSNRATGDVHAIIGVNLRDGNIWYNIELDRLKNKFESYISLRFI